MDISQLFGAVTRAISDRTGPVQDVDTGGFLGEVAGMFRQHAGATNQQIDDSYARPHLDQYQGQEVLPASMDSYGDPADQEMEQNILPASEDPYGDPADQRR